ncbi:MAG TPA: STAS domain-containing protein [Herpetosiphonaceae bacterium]|nr:STAS domain-containing protein [Herpetosiphonaceae bacterium]
MVTQLRTRLLISNLVTVLLVAGLVAFALLERSSLDAQIDKLAAQEQAAGRARELSLYVQYNAHDTNAYTLGHLEHSQEYEEHAAAFATVLTDIQSWIDREILDEDEQESVDQIKALHVRYEQAAHDLFAAADGNRAAPTAAAQALQDSTWEIADGLGDELDEASQELANRIDADVAVVQADLDARNQRMIIVLLGLGMAVIAGILAIQYSATTTLGKPLQNLLGGVQSFTRGQLDTRVAVARQDEVGTLSGAFNELAVTIQRQTEDLQRQYERAVAAQTETEKAREQIARQLDTIEQKDTLLREISVPVLPLSKSTLVMPLVGALDTERLRLIQHQALQNLEGRSMKCLILDITGVPVVDTQVAQGLMQVIQSARLLGTETVVVGVRPEVAQTIVQLGINLNTVTTRSSLEGGIAYALNRS